MAEKKTEKNATEKNADAKASKDEQVGFHKGSLATLSKERQELSRILSIVDQLLQMHVSALKELGVDLEKEAEKLLGKEGAEHITPSTKGPTKPRIKPPIEDVI